MLPDERMRDHSQTTIYNFRNLYKGHKGYVIQDDKSLTMTNTFYKISVKQVYEESGDTKVIVSYADYPVLKFMERFCKEIQSYYPNLRKVYYDSNNVVFELLEHSFYFSQTYESKGMKFMGMYDQVNLIKDLRDKVKVLKHNIKNLDSEQFKRRMREINIDYAASTVYIDDMILSFISSTNDRQTTPVINNYY